MNNYVLKYLESLETQSLSTICVSNLREHYEDLREYYRARNLSLKQNMSLKEIEQDEKLKEYLFFVKESIKKILKIFYETKNGIRKKDESLDMESLESHINIYKKEVEKITGINFEEFIKEED